MSYRWKQLVILIALCLSLVLFLPQSRAQETYSQPMTEIKWTTHTLFISIPDSPLGARTSILQAIDIWNKAQEWFIQSYYPNQHEAIFTLKPAEVGQPAQVTVQYVTQLPNGYWAETTGYGTRILIVIGHLDNQSGNVVLVAHELGHVLGIGDNSIAGDLERSSDVYSPYPSTLNLYGVFLQAKCQCYTGDDAITLPPTIQYAVWNPSLVVPEFPNALVVLIVALIIGALVTCRRRI